MPGLRKLPDFAVVLSVVALLGAAWACGGGGGSGVGPTAPQEPVPTGNVGSLSGTYYGQSGLLSVSGCGCVEEVAQAWLNSEEDWWGRGGRPINYFEWELQQLNAAIEGTIFFSWEKGLVGPSRCETEGTKPNYLELDSPFSADTVRCEQDPFSVECADGRSRELRFESLHWEGVLIAPQVISFGEWTGTWRCLDPANGHAVGDLVLRGEWGVLAVYPAG